MQKFDPDMQRALELRAIILNTLDALECYDDPAPAAVDLIDIAMLLGRALDLLSPRRGKYTAGLDKADEAINELDRRLASIEPQTATIIDLCEILRQRNSMDDGRDRSRQQKPVASRHWLWGDTIRRLKKIFLALPRLSRVLA